MYSGKPETLTPATPADGLEVEGDSPELRKFLADEGLESGCYIVHIAANYEGSDRPKKGFQKWLSGLSAFLEEFEDSSGQACVRLKAAELLDREAGVQDESQEPD